MKRHSKEHINCLHAGGAARNVLARLGLPANLIKLIREGTLLQAIEHAYKRIDETNALLDAWEAQNPAAAKLVPWAEAREAWKRAGRPSPPWYEALQCLDGPAPITEREVRGRVYPYTGAVFKRRKRERERAARG